MKKLLASVLCAALALSAAPVSLIAAGKAARGLQSGQITGQAMVDGKPLGNVCKVRLRNFDTKEVAGEMQADAAGIFNFTKGLAPGKFVVETIGANGSILGTSTVITLTATTLVATGILVSTTAAVLDAAGGIACDAAGILRAGGGGVLGMTTTTASAVAASLAALTIAAFIVTKDDASPAK